MQNRIIRRMTIPGAALATTAALLASGAASAHVTVEPKEATPGGSVIATFYVNHGCEGEPTTSVRMQIPEGAYGVKVMPKPGWEIATEMGPLPAPVEQHGNTITEGVTEITWSGGSLPDDQFDGFTVRLTLPDTPVGETVYFPVIQACPSGAEEAWIVVPEDGQPEPDFPAPGIAMLAADAASDEGDDGADEAGASATEDAATPAGADAIDTESESASTNDSDDDSDDDSSMLTYVALGLGALGLVAGGGALISGMRRGG